MKETVLFLEGGEGVDFYTAFEDLTHLGFECLVLDNLYEEPNKLKQIVEIDPDYLFIGTTGQRPEEREVLIETFKSLNYLPKAVMFFSDDSVWGYLHLARELKNLGTKFYFSPSRFGLPWDLEEYEISWI